jgi:hypothetical protein
MNVIIILIGMFALMILIISCYKECKEEEDYNKVKLNIAKEEKENIEREMNIAFTYIDRLHRKDKRE